MNGENMEIKYIENAKILKALSDPKRLKIIDMLSCGELCACKIQEEFNITQPTLSHDMRVLKEAGLTNERREGQRILYSLNTDLLKKLQSSLTDIFEPSDDCICHKLNKQI